MISLITGGTKGIGLGCAKKLNSLGYTPVLVYGHDDKAAEEVKNTYGFDTIKCDITDFSQVEKMVDFVVKKYGKIDVLVNSCGIALMQNLLIDQSILDIQKCVNTNLVGTMLVTKYVLLNMVKNRMGVIVNVSSIYGEIGGSCEAVYSATKGGINAFTKALAKEVANANIRVNAVAPGFIDTQMNAHITEKEREEFCENLLIPRIGTPEDIASAVEFLVTNTYITGQIITVDGGMSN